MLTFFLTRMFTSRCNCASWIQQEENLKNVQKWSTSTQQEKRESEERECNRHKSKQMFYSLKRTAKIPPNGLIKWQELHFSSTRRKQKKTEI